MSYLPALIYALLRKVYAVLTSGLVTLASMIGGRFDNVEKTLRALSLDNAETWRRIEELQRSCSLAFQAIEAELRELRDDTQKILAALQPLPAVAILFDVLTEGQFFEGATSMQMTDTQKSTITLRPVDKAGNPAPVQAGSVVWDDSEVKTVAGVTPSADGLSIDVVSAGPLGSGQLRVSADADLGDGVVTISDAIQITIVAGQAVGLGLTASEPVEQ